MYKKNHPDRVGEGSSEAGGKLLSGGHLEEGGASSLPPHLEQHLCIFVTLSSLLSSQFNFSLQAFFNPVISGGRMEIRKEMGKLLFLET